MAHFIGVAVGDDGGGCLLGLACRSEIRTGPGDRSYQQRTWYSYVIRVNVKDKRGTINPKSAFPIKKK